MFPYWILFAFVALGSVQYEPNPQVRLQGGLPFTLCGVAIALMIGLRYQVGGDWQHYLDIYNFAVNFGAGVQDPAYELLNVLAGRAGLGVWFVNLVCGAVFTVGLAAFARRQPNPWLCILVSIPYLVIVVAMGYTRQAVAIGLILLGFAYLERSFVRFVICAVLAATFHKSAVVVLPFVALTKTKSRYLTALVLLITMVVAYYALVQASADILVSNYVGQQYSSQGAAIRVAMNIPPALAFFLLRRRLALSPLEQTLWRNFAIGAFVSLVALIVSPSSTAVDRLSLYLIPLQLFVWGRLPFSVTESRRGRLAMTLLIVAYSASIQFVWLTYADNARYWVPYRFFPTAETAA